MHVATMWYVDTMQGTPGSKGVPGGPGMDGMKGRRGPPGFPGMAGKSGRVVSDNAFSYGGNEDDDTLTHRVKLVLQERVVQWEVLDPKVPLGILALQVPLEVMVTM